MFVRGGDNFMSGLFNKEVTPPAITTEPTPPLSFLGKGAKASNEADLEKAAKLRTLDEISRKATQRDALRAAGRRPRR